MLKISIRSVVAASRGILKATGLRAMAPAIAMGLLVASPAHADFSEGYKFLEAVKKKEGEKVEKALMDSAQIVNAKDVTTPQIAAAQFPRAVQILDYYHASQHLYTVAHACFGEESPAAQAAFPVRASCR